MPIVELLGRRTKTQKVFDLGAGLTRYECHTGHIHYLDTGQACQDIDTTLRAQAGGSFMDRDAYQLELPALATGQFPAAP